MVWCLFRRFVGDVLRYCFLVVVLALLEGAGICVQLLCRRSYVLCWSFVYASMVVVMDQCNGVWDSPPYQRVWMVYAMEVLLYQCLFDGWLSSALGHCVTISDVTVYWVR